MHLLSGGSGRGWGGNKVCYGRLQMANKRMQCIFNSVCKYVSIADCFTKLLALFPFAIGNPVWYFLAWELRSIAGITSFEHL